MLDLLGVVGYFPTTICCARRFRSGRAPQLEVPRCDLSPCASSEPYFSPVSPSPSRLPRASGRGIFPPLPASTSANPTPIAEKPVCGRHDAPIARASKPAIRAERAGSARARCADRAWSPSAVRCSIARIAAWPTESGYSDSVSRTAVSSNVVAKSQTRRSKRASNATVTTVSARTSTIRSAASMA